MIKDEMGFFTSLWKDGGKAGMRPGQSSELGEQDFLGGQAVWARGSRDTPERQQVEPIQTLLLATLPTPPHAPSSPGGGAQGLAGPQLSMGEK